MCNGYITHMVRGGGHTKSAQHISITCSLNHSVHVHTAHKHTHTLTARRRSHCGRGALTNLHSCSTLSPSPPQGRCNSKALRSRKALHRLQSSPTEETTRGVEFCAGDTTKEPRKFKVHPTMAREQRRDQQWAWTTVRVSGSS